MSPCHFHKRILKRCPHSQSFPRASMTTFQGFFDIPFLNYFHNLLAGKVYKESDNSTDLILAFEKETPTGQSDLKEVAEEIKYTLPGKTLGEPIKLNK